jgi:hypothetical protein
VLGGIIDATAGATVDTGGVEVWLGVVGFNTPNPAQTFVGGKGGDFVHVTQNGGDVIDFSAGGGDGDTVEFSGGTRAGSNLVPPPELALNDTTHQYNNVLGFSGGDSVNVSVGGIGVPLSYTDLPPTAVAAGDATSAFSYLAPGLTEDATTSHSNFIDFVSPITALPGASPQEGFIDAIASGKIDVQGAGTYLMSYYDTTHSEAVLGTVTTGAGVIDNTASVRVVGLIHESAADYAALAGHTHFV